MSIVAQLYRCIFCGTPILHYRDLTCYKCSKDEGTCSGM